MLQGLHWFTTYGFIRSLARVGLWKGDPLARLVLDPAAVADDSGPFFDELRALGPLVQGRVCYLTTDYEICSELLRSDDFRVMSFGANFPAPLRWLEQRVRGDLLHTIRAPSMVAVEGADHVRLRKAVSAMFTARAVSRLHEGVEQTAVALLDQMPSVVDIAATYCSDLPVAVISDMLGVPEQDRSEIRQCGLLASPSLDLAMPWRQYRDTQKGIAGINAWVTHHMSELRRNPNDSLMGQLIQTNDTLSETELRSVAGFLLTAGFETTVNLLGNGIAMLLDRPEQLERLHQHPQLWPNAVEEILRLEAPSQFTARVAAKDIEVAGTKVRRGEFVVLYLAAANRDPRVFPDPHRFDVERSNAGRHLSFSGGRHFCLGASLARAKGEVGLRMLFQRYPQLQLASPGVRRDSRVLRGWASLPVALHG